MPTAVCARPRYETMLTAIIAGLIHERTMPPGSIVDSGAFRGEWACYYAKQDRNRTVYAIEPDEANIAHIQRAYEYLPNVRPVHAALGANAVADVGWKDRGKLGLNLYPKQGQKENPSTNWSFPVRRVDDLFSSEQLGLLHLDVEFHELEVLRGAEAVIARDQPIITTEVMVHSLRNETVEGPLRWLKARGYDSYLIDEICGMRADFRNLLHLPRTRAFLGSSTLDLAVAARALVAVDGNTVRDYAFPCCEPGGGCCPLSRGRPAGSCCAHWRVHAWLVEQAKAGAIDLSLAFATRTNWYDQKARRFAAHAHLQRMQAHDLRRADLLNASGRVHTPGPGGFSYYEAGYEKEDAHVGVRLPS